MTKEEKNRIADLREQGLGYTKIAQVLGISVNTIKSYCRRNPSPKQIPERIVQSEHVCKNCGVVVPQNPGRKEKQFCCDKCRNQWWNSHLDQVNRKAYRNVTCLHCGKVFTAYGKKERKYCSVNCYNEDRVGRC